MATLCPVTIKTPRVVFWPPAGAREVSVGLNTEGGVAGGSIGLTNGAGGVAGVVGFTGREVVGRATGAAGRSALVKEQAQIKKRLSTKGINL
jgi:hypothetical protein